MIKRIGTILTIFSVFLIAISKANGYKHSVTSNNDISRVNQYEPLEVKTYLIRQFIPFINTWSGGHKEKPKNEPYRIVVLGDKGSTNVQKTVEYLENEFEVGGRKILDRRIDIRHYDSLEEYLKSSWKADIFYLQEIRRSNELAPIFAYTTKHNIFLLSDGKDLCIKGAHVGFYISGGRVTFAVNRCAVEQAGIKFNYQVYEQANRIINNCNE